MGPAFLAPETHAATWNPTLAVTLTHANPHVFTTYPLALTVAAAE